VARDLLEQRRAQVGAAQQVGVPRGAEVEVGDDERSHLLSD
jgi:hypothetical protein